MSLPNVPSITVLGKLTFEPTDPPRPLGTYVLQRVKPGLGNIESDPTRSLQLRLHAPRVDKNSAAQQARRARVAGAVADWHALDAPTKAEWRDRAKPRRITGFNAFVSAWLTGALGPSIDYIPAHGMRHPRAAAPVTPHARGVLRDHGTRAAFRPAAPYVPLPAGAPTHGTRYLRTTGTTPPHERGTLRDHGTRAAFRPAAPYVPLPSGAATHGTRRLHTAGTTPDHARGVLRDHGTRSRLRKV